MIQSTLSFTTKVVTEPIILNKDKFIIVSGSQCGVDHGSHLAARELGIEIGGYAPQGYWTEKGANLELKTWGLKDYPTRGYDARDKANVDLCDIVIAFRLNIPKTGRGTCKTYNYAFKGKYEDSVRPSFSDAKNGVFEMRNVENIKSKPVLILWDPMTHSAQYVATIKEFLHRNTVTGKKINVLFSGPCESTQPGIENCIKTILIACFK